MPQTTEELLETIKIQNNRFDKDFREKRRGLFAVLDAVVRPVELVANLASGASSIAFPPASMCMGAVVYLVGAARGVSDSLDAVEQLLHRLKDFTIRLGIYSQVDLSAELQEQLTAILVTLLDVFALSTKVINDGTLHRFRSFGKNFLLGNDTKMQSLLDKLDNLTRSESQLVAADTWIETKRTGSAVTALQHSMAASSSQLTDQISTGFDIMRDELGQVRDQLDQSRKEYKKVHDMKFLETIARSLHPTQLAEGRFLQIEGQHLVNSGEWVEQEPAFQVWVSGQSPILWISGNPGAGKSFLAYKIVTLLRDRHQGATAHSANASTTFFFFMEANNTMRSFEQALRDICYQIAQVDQVYARHVATFCQTDLSVAPLYFIWQRLFVDFYIRGDPSNNSAYVVLDGLDEAHAEGRQTFFEMLQDVQRAGAQSRLHIALLGRPQIVDEIYDDVPTVHVNDTKTSDDIAQYVRVSINKSRKLKSVSESLKNFVVQTISSKAEGMFLWVRLMIEELSQKSREDSIRNALEKAPRGLPEMLTHVLEGYSASLGEEDADILNDILAWVVAARRPLTLGEVDSMLRLQSPEGYPVLDLESKLRNQFSSFFVLWREDNLTTSDLHDTFSDEANGDPRLETKARSDPETTTVSFAHASLSDYFRDANRGKVTAAGDDHLPVGVNIHEARVKIARTCVDLIMARSLLDSIEGRDPESFIEYAQVNWKEHLDELDATKLRVEDKIYLGSRIAQMMYEDKAAYAWNQERGREFFTLKTAESIKEWIADEKVLAELPQATCEWIRTVLPRPREIFEPAVRNIGKQWFRQDGFDCGHYPNACALVVGYLVRKDISLFPDFDPGRDGGEISRISPTDIRTAANWLGFEENAEWHRCLAVALRDWENIDDALTEFDQALQMDNSLLRAHIGKSKAYLKQNRYAEALQSDKSAMDLAESQSSPRLGQCRMRVGLCYRMLGSDEEDTEERSRLWRLAIQNFSNAFAAERTLYECIKNNIDILNEFPTRPEDGEKVRQEEAAKATATVMPTRRECCLEVYQMLHNLDAANTDKPTSVAKLLYEYGEDDYFFTTLARMASEAEQLEWLEEQYREAITYAKDSLKFFMSIRLQLSLATLYGLFRNDYDNALPILRGVGLQAMNSTAEATDTGSVRQKALNELGRHCLLRAIEKNTEAHRYVAELRDIASRPQRGYGGEYALPRNSVPLRLATWYSKQGQHELAKNAARGHLREALAILSDDDPTNDELASWNIASAFVALRDDDNALAIFGMRRRYTQDGVAAVVNNNQDDELKAGPWGEGWVCDGYNWTCWKVHPDCDGLIKCRFCNIDLCTPCHQDVLNGTMIPQVCSKDHEFLVVPSLAPERSFKRGEIRVGDQVMLLEDWKSIIRKQYEL